MAELERKSDEVIYRKEITTDNPNSHTEVTLRFENLTEESTTELRKHFLKLCEEVEKIVEKETSLTN